MKMGQENLNGELSELYEVEGEDYCVMQKSLGGFFG
jgi:hypothetical protein